MTREAVTIGPRLAGRCLLFVVILVLAAETAYVVRVVQTRGIFDYIALDYRASRAAGEMLPEHGLGAPYDFELIDARQRLLYQDFVSEEQKARAPYYLVPVPYPPPFTLLFYPSTLLAPIAGYLAWALLHLAALVFCQVRLARVFGIREPSSLILAVCLSMPSFIHLMMGQISVWLLIFMSEAIIAFARGRMFRTGLFLGLLVVKPQTLPLILPALLLARRWRVLTGVAACWAVIAGLTLPFAPQWLPGFIENILRSAGSTGQDMAIFPSSMINWRAFGMFAARFLPAGLSWTVAVCGMIATALMGLACGRRLGSSHRREWSLAWLGIVSATCVFVWHSHVHLVLLVVPALYAAIPEWPKLRIAVETTMFASPLFFIPTAVVFSIGLAHDLLGQAIFILLLILCTACLVLLRRNAGVSGSRSEIESDA